MGIIIDGIDFEELEAEKYWSFPKSYKGNPREETQNMIMSGNYLGARKMDGAYFRFIKGENGERRLQSRSESVNGGFLNKYDWVPQLHEFFDKIPNGSCLLGEIYFPNKEGSRHVTTIMGCLPEKAKSRQEAGEKLHYYIFDIWAWEGKSYLNMTAECRFSYVGALGNNNIYKYPYVEFAKYYYGIELWEELSRVRQLDGEGIVITKSDSIPAPGKRTARKTLKIKKELDSPIDCFITGKYRPATREYKGDHIEDWQYWENTKTMEKVKGFMYKEYAHGATLEPISKAYYYGWASAIEIGVMDNNKPISLGWISGITEEIREGIVTSVEKYLHKVVIVNAMDYDKESRRLRHGKILEWRAPGDKDWTECSIEQLE